MVPGTVEQFRRADAVEIGHLLKFPPINLNLSVYILR
jgi:hypothetical protein